MNFTADWLKGRLHYDPLTGQFKWLVNVARRSPAGSVAGTFEARGYIRISIEGRKYLAHRLAWLYMTGEWPKNQIDHRDLNASNNAWSNLREATHGQNIANQGARKNNLSGWKGIYFRHKRRKWRAAIYIESRKVDLGLFACPAAAHLAYLLAAVRHFGEFARGR